MSNWTGCGHRLGPDQNGAPELVIWSGGKLYSSCLIWLQKLSSNRCRAHDTQSAKCFGRPSTSTLFTASTFSICNERKKREVFHKPRGTMARHYHRFYTTQTETMDGSASWGARLHPSFCRHQVILLGDRHMGVNNLPKGCYTTAWQPGSNPRPLSHQSNALTNRLPSHPLDI